MRRTPLIVAVCLHAAHAAWSDVPDWLLTNASDWHTPTLRDGRAARQYLAAPETRCLAFSNGLLTQIFARPDDGGFGTVALTGSPRSRAPARGSGAARAEPERPHATASPSPSAGSFPFAGPASPT